ncbi:adenosylcobinamide amidohydrolase [Pontibacillus salicampi]|uniref:Adenosylcobinamide amidohydrolase n=1 Tax=Pontibacillus salicampi TaxID=1449801 RepID=A0ABV6LK11_9BACI
MIEASHLYAGYDTYVVKDVSFSVHKGEMFGILGPNGSGKTTLLKAINRTISNAQGDISIEGVSVTSLSSKQIAQKMAVLPQHQDISFSFTVEQTVLMGRYPYQRGLFKQWTKEDYELVEKVMNQTGIASFRHQTIQALSGGERQRVFLAQALAQQPDILLLDEPTNHLDFSYQKQMLDALKEWSIQEKLTVIAIFHDLNLASLYCDRLLLLNDGTIHALNTPEEIMKEETLQYIYQSTIKVNANPHLAKPLMHVVPHYTDIHGKSHIERSRLLITDQHIHYHSPKPLKCYSSAVMNAGFGWYEDFLNVHVDKSFSMEDPLDYVKAYAEGEGMPIHHTVGMMTAAHLKDGSYRYRTEDGVTLLVVVTAGTSNAVDVVHGNQHVSDCHAGTINTWIFVDGVLAEEAYIQSIMTATEAKVRALVELDIRDAVTGTLATGTSTDSTLIASTQEGKTLAYGGPISLLGKMIGTAVYEATKEAIEQYQYRVGNSQ